MVSDRSPPPSCMSKMLPALTLGPVAELGLAPLNAHPAQSFLAQSRPYSFGVEAGVEFGR